MSAPLHLYATGFLSNNATRDPFLDVLYPQKKKKKKLDTTVWHLLKWLVKLENPEAELIMVWNNSLFLWLVADCGLYYPNPVRSASGYLIFYNKFSPQFSGLLEHMLASNRRTCFAVWVCGFENRFVVCLVCISWNFPLDSCHRHSANQTKDTRP